MPDLAFDADVIIVGCGPVGAVAANFLGMHGVRTIVVERETSPHGQPRAFSCDDEALRIYQQIGLVELLRADMVSPERVDYTGVGGRKFAEIAVGALDFGAGYSPLHFFYQPLLERTLRDGLARHRSVELRPGHEVDALRQDADGVTLEVSEPATRTRHTLRARYVLACDGAHSPVRRLLGVELVGRRYDEPWLAVSGLASEDAIRVPATTFVCDPARPCFVGKGPAGDFRMEFMLQPGEQPADMERPDVIKRLVAPFVDPDRLEIRRAVVYRFGNAVAARWQVDRVLLLGDAAHQMPPFMGQGLVSGLRDVANLCWKLALVLRAAAVVDPALLASYEAERRPHVRAMADVSVRMGHIFLAHSPALARVRDGLFRLLDHIPRARKFIRDFEFKPGPAIDHGLISGGRRRSARAPEGSYFPQPRVRTDTGYRVLLDDLLGPGFAVVGLDCDPSALVGDTAPWSALGARFISIMSPGTGTNIPSAAVDESGRLTAWFRRHGAAVAIVRPDRFVYGVASAASAPALARALAADLRGSLPVTSLDPVAGTADPPHVGLGRD
jgi:3-(3-hydroxy-phenyl)propionate hydroxylase